jgi:geranylgeranyl diphosphate synthase type II
MNADKLTELIEREITLLNWDEEPRNLYEPIEYLLSLGGKRMRPLLVLMGYGLFKKDFDHVLRPALLVEVFHNFTLMHDDIMDQAPIRRSHPTVHEKWNQTVAILSGDTMLVKAYQLMENLPPPMLREAFRKFNQCAIDVCAGQQLDMNFESREDVEVSEYMEMIRLKTAVLLGFSLEFGALLAEAGEDVQQRLYKLGIDLGLAFQLMDDHLDTFGDEKFGKKIGGDIVANKKTFLLINALKSGNPKHVSLLRKWLQTQGKDDEKIHVVRQIYIDEGIEERSRDRIHFYADQAAAILADIPGDPEAKQHIEAYITWLNQRVA